EAAARWFAAHGFPVEAIRHAQAAQDWGLAARLLADNWPGLHLGGQAATVHALLAGFPAGAIAADAELATVAAADELAQGSLEEAKRLLGLAARRLEGPASVPAGRRGQAHLLLGGVRLAEAEPHLDQGITLARRIGRPYLEFLGLGHSTSIASVRSSPYALAEEHAPQTIELAPRP